MRVRGKEGYRIASNGSSIGIDFNWKEESLSELLTKLSREYPFIDFGIHYKGHKCNFDIKYKKAELNSVLELLKYSFEDINVELMKKETYLLFLKEFDKYDDLVAFRALLANK